MSEKMNQKPVKCGCGGEAHVSDYKTVSDETAFYVSCRVCDTSTRSFLTKDKAIEAWNTAMGERTAKVIDKSVGRHSISDFDWTGKCEKCGNEIQYSFDFCPYCGDRLEWEWTE